MAIEVMGNRIEGTVRALAVAMHEVEGAFAQLELDRAGTGAEIARAERLLKHALDGMTLERWEALVSERASIRTAADSREAHLAKKRRSAVEKAQSEVSAARSGGARDLARAENTLDEAVQKLQRFGPLAIRLAPKSRTSGSGPAYVARRVPSRCKQSIRRSSVKVRNAIKDYQRRLAELDADYSRAQDHLKAVLARREKVIKEQDRLVAAAQKETEEAIGAMALEAGADLTASLLGVDGPRVRRLLKVSQASPRPAGTSGTGKFGPASGD